MWTLIWMLWFVESQMESPKDTQHTFAMLKSTRPSTFEDFSYKIIWVYNLVKNVYMKQTLKSYIKHLFKRYIWLESNLVFHLINFQLSSVFSFFLKCEYIPQKNQCNPINTHFYNYVLCTFGCHRAVHSFWPKTQNMWKQMKTQNRFHQGKIGW